MLSNIKINHKMKTQARMNISWYEDEVLVVLAFLILTGITQKPTLKMYFSFSQLAPMLSFGSVTSHHF
jgi:hypothetical protein